MKKLITLLAVLCLLCSCAGDRANVITGSQVNHSQRMEALRTMSEDKLGTLALLGRIAVWTPSELEEMGKYCRAKGLTISICDFLDRRNWGVLPERKDSLDEMIAVFHRYPDVFTESHVLGEFSGVMFTWPQSSMRGGNACMPQVKTYTEAEAFIRYHIQRQIAFADSIGLPRPFVSVDYGDVAQLLRQKLLDRVDVELIFDGEYEKRYADVVGACKAFDVPGFGTDHAVTWYGGDDLGDVWYNRTRLSLYHAYLRGSSPTWLEGPILKYNGYDKRKWTGDHPHLVRYRKILGDYAAWLKKHPRPEGLPRAAAAFMKGRLDGYSGMWQTHKWGQRLNDDFLIGDDERAWNMVEECYHREDWESRDRGGDRNYSGNPPLGMVNIVPHDIPDDVLSQYKVLVFLGFNSMDDTLYAKLQRYVSSGGTLLLTARHFDTADRPRQAFTPYNNGDWSALTGLKVIPGKRQKMQYGLKFTALPSCGWKLHQYGLISDPFFTDGGFSMPVFENCGATPIAVGSKNFIDTEFNFDETLLYEYRIGEGSVIFCPSLDSVGSPQLYPLYEYLVRRALESVDAYPKVECTDAVRWSCYDDGSVLVLNTEDNIRQEIILHSDANHSRKVTLRAGELKILKP